MLLISGATGFVGRYLLKEFLSTNIPLMALYRTPSRKEETVQFLKQQAPEALRQIEAIEWRQADLTEWSSLEMVFEKGTHLIHAAATVSLYAGDERKMIEINTAATAQLVDWALQNKIEWFGHVSSIAALGAGTAHLPIDEESTWNDEAQYSAYGYSKYLAELEVWRGFEEGLKGCIFNPGVILGSGAPNSPLAQLLDQQKKGLQWLTSGGTGFVAVEDVVKAIRLAYEQKIHRERFVLVSDNWSYEELLKQIYLFKNKSFKPFRLSEKQLRLVYRLEQILGFLGKKRKLTPALINSLVERSHYENTKSTRQIKDFRYSKLSERLKDYLSKE